MAPELYQMHKLFNFSTASMAATIQCYGYLGIDTNHHETFDYVLDNDTKLHYFAPNANFTFEELLPVVRREYEEHTRKKKFSLFSRPRK